MLSAFESVDFVTVFHEPTPHELLQRIKPDLLVKGGDYAPEAVVGREIVEAYGGQVRVVGAYPGLSTSKIVARLAEPAAP